MIGIEFYHKKNAPQKGKTAFGFRTKEIENHANIPLLLVDPDVSDQFQPPLLLVDIRHNARRLARLKRHLLLLATGRKRPLL
jgi:hypothetical protein